MDLELVDDRSDPERAALIHRELRERCELVIGPYGSDSTRAVAADARGSVVWNHGAAADDVQTQPAVVSLPTPSSRYLVALARGVATLLPGAGVLVGAASGPFARAAVAGLRTSAGELGLELLGVHSLKEVVDEAASQRPDAVLVCGSLRSEARVLARLEREAPRSLLGGVSPGVADFREVAGIDLIGAIAPVQWHPDAVEDVRLGPPFRDLAAFATARGAGVDYVGVQACAAAIIAHECRRLSPDSPLRAARTLRTSTLYGAFALDPTTGKQTAHRLGVIRRTTAGPRLLLVEPDTVEAG